MYCTVDDEAFISVANPYSCYREAGPGVVNVQRPHLCKLI